MIPEKMKNGNEQIKFHADIIAKPLNILQHPQHNSPSTVIFCSNRSKLSSA